MGREFTVRARLRAATAPAHERVDRAYSGFDLAIRDDYVRFLQGQGHALLPLEQALGEGIAPDLDIEWEQRRRGPALLADLDALGAAREVTSGFEPIEPLIAPASALGTIYVLEGSRLGGVILERAVDRRFPAAFLAPGPPGAWRSLMERLETALSTQPLIDEAIAAASATFARFERSAHLVAERAV